MKFFIIMLFVLCGCATSKDLASTNARLDIIEMEIKLLKERPCQCPDVLPIPDPEDDKK